MAGPMRIAVIGAGMGGLTAAIALQQAGHDVSVHEQAPELGDVGAGLTLAPNATRVYQSLGLLDELRQHTDEPRFSCAMHYQSGEHLATWELGRELEEKHGAPFLQIHRADLHSLLASRVQQHNADAIKLNQRFVRFEQNGTGVAATFANGDTVESDILIGADGSRSNVRAQMFDPEPPVFTGHVAWRGLIPVSTLPRGLDPDTALAIGPKRFIARYYVRHQTYVNIVAFARMDGWEIESWSELADMNELRETFADWNDEVQMLLGAIPPELCFKWALFSRPPLESWVQNRVALLGDAAHPMLPFLGMGAATAIEDGLVLARALETSPQAATGLQRYDAARRPRGDFIMAASEKRVAELQSEHPEQYDSDSEKSEISLGLFEYDASTTPV